MTEKIITREYKTAGKSFGKRLHNCRADHDYTQTELAEIVGVQKNTICRWERDETQPKASEIQRLAQALNVTCDYLVTGEETPHECENCAIAIEDRAHVVRCKNCKYLTVIHMSYASYNTCDKKHGIGMPDDWFCADGKIK